MAKKSTTDSLLDLAGDLIGGKDIDAGDLVDLVTGSSSSSSKKKSSNSGSLIAKLLGDNEYPQMSEKSYWAIRAKFQKSIPSKVIASTLTSATGLQAASVKSTILPALQAMGLINSKGTPTSTLRAWCDDDRYEETCKKIRTDLYPTSLRKLDYDTKTAQRSVLSWFKKNADVAETTAKKMMAVYLLLSEATPKETSSSSTSKSGSSTSSSKSTSANSLSVTKKSGKVVISIKMTVDEDITNKELAAKFDDLYTKTVKKI